MKIQNPLVQQVYSRDDEVNHLLRETLTIELNDSTVTIVQKLLVFYLACDKLSTTVEEYLLVNNPTVEKSPDRIRISIKFKCDKRFYQDETGRIIKTGYRQFEVPNLSLDYVNKNPDYFPSLAWKIGSQKIIYTMKDGHQIKFHGYNVDLSHKLMNAILKAVEPSLKLGTSEEHSYLGNPPKDIKKSPLHGETVKCYKVTFVDVVTGKSTGSKLY